MYINTAAAVYIIIKNQPHSASPARNTLLTLARVPTRNAAMVCTLCLCIMRVHGAVACSGRCSGEGPYLKWEFRLSIRKRKSRDGRSEYYRHIRDIESILALGDK